MKLWAMPCRATQVGWVMVESSDKTCSTGGGNGEPLQYPYLENPMNSMKRQKDMIPKEELPRSVGAQYATREKWRDNSGKNEGMEPKWKQHSVVNVTCDGSKSNDVKNNIRNLECRSMNQRKLKVVKQEMERVNIDVLGISGLKCTGMGEFNSDDHYIYYCGQESFRRNGVALIVNKSSKCRTWVQSQKQQNDPCSFPRQTIQYHGKPSLCTDQ